jgi:hypothetical protein
MHSVRSRAVRTDKVPNRIVTTNAIEWELKQNKFVGLVPNYQSYPYECFRT